MGNKYGKGSGIRDGDENYLISTTLVLWHCCLRII